MPDPLLDTPEFREAVERAKEAWHKPPSAGPGGTGYLAGNWEEKLESALTSCLPALRKAIAREVREEAEREVTERGSPFFRGMLAQGAHFGWKEAADFIERAE